LDRLRDILARGFIRAEGTSLRVEDEKKALELVGFLAELSRAFIRAPAREPAVVVDAAAGKGYVGLVLALLGETRANRDVHVTFIERDPRRIEHIREAARALAVPDATIAPKAADVADPSAWPEEPHLVCSLHACGDATDRVIDRASQAHARFIVIAPCCVTSQLPAAMRAERRAEALGFGKLPEVRRRFAEAHVLGERALALEAAGYVVETVPFVAPTITPYNVALRATRSGDRDRAARARGALARLVSEV
jgi:hypothetical protein